MRKPDIHKELEQHAPKLSKLKKPDVPAAPEGYFDALEENLLARIETEGLSHTTRPKRHLSFWKKGLWAAAASMLLVGAFWYLQKPIQTDTNEILAFELEDDEIESYVLENISEFESENLSAYFNEDLALDTTTWYNAADALLEQYDPEDFEDFL